MHITPAFVVFWCFLLLVNLQSDGLVQGCSNSIANALELLQSYTEPSRYLSVPLHCHYFNQTIVYGTLK